MSNLCYLTISDEGQSPVRGQPGFSSEKQFVLQAAYHVPLLWPMLFGSSSMRELVEDGKTYWEWVTLKEEALGRLSARRDYFISMFAANGGLSNHISLLASFLDSIRFKYVHLESFENTVSLGNFPIGTAKELLLQLDSKDPIAKSTLVDWSTVMIERRFITLEDRDAKRYENEDMHNFFRIMGDNFWGDHSAPWA